MSENIFKLFCGSDFYPRGGYNDFFGNFESIELAKKYVDENHIEYYLQWAQIVKNDEILLIGDRPFSIKLDVKKDFEWKFYEKE